MPSIPTSSHWIKENPWLAWIYYTIISGLLYLWASRYPISSPFIVNASQFDDMIPFIWQAIPLYFSYFLLLPLFIILNRHDRNFSAMFLVVGFYTLINLSLCIFFPTCISERVGEGYNQYLVQYLMMLDTANAALPSGHVGLPCCLFVVTKRLGSGSFLFALWTVLLATVVLLTSLWCESNRDVSRT